MENFKANIFNYIGSRTELKADGIKFKLTYLGGNAKIELIKNGRRAIIQNNPSSNSVTLNGRKIENNIINGLRSLVYDILDPVK